MRKKVIILITSLLIVTTLLSACGNSKYKVSGDSELTKEDMKILQKKYEELTEDEEIELATMSFDMTADEYIKFKDDLKRLHAEKMVSKGLMTNERADELFEKSYDYNLRKKQGKLTEEEIKEEKEREELQAKNKAEEADVKYDIQKKLDKIKEEHEDIETLEIEKYSVAGLADIRLRTKTLKEVTVGEINSIRVKTADAVVDTIDKEDVTVKIELYLGGDELKDTYRFKLGEGWDKKVEP